MSDSSMIGTVRDSVNTSLMSGTVRDSVNTSSSESLVAI